MPLVSVLLFEIEIGIEIVFPVLAFRDIAGFLLKICAP